MFVSEIILQLDDKRQSIHIVRVLALVRSGLDVAAVELVVQHVARVLLGFVGGVGVVEVGFVAADDVSWVGHFGWVDWMGIEWDGVGLDWLEMDVVADRVFEMMRIMFLASEPLRLYTAASLETFEQSSSPSSIGLRDEDVLMTTILARLGGSNNQIAAPSHHTAAI